METSLERIKQIVKERETENWEFRAFLKGCESMKIDPIVHKLYQKISLEIDCQTCANCCKETETEFDQEDIERFSKGLNISSSQFKDQYLVGGDFSNEYILREKPCPFLKNNLCSNYSYRPKGCQSYPHLHKVDFTRRLMSVIGNYAICPIVFNVYEELKDAVWKHKKREK